MKRRVALASLAALGWVEAAGAQPAMSPGSEPPAHGAGQGLVAPGATRQQVAPPPTDIRADSGALGLGTQVTRNGNVHTIDGGTRAGDNLFHSFGRFDLGQGDFARWVHSAGDPAAIRNVVNRVTGGDPSRIFGTLDSSALPNADFYFINPAGIVFGEGARVNVPAAAHFSTAWELRFADGPAFTVATPGGSTFSVTNPVAFGFLGGQGSITAENLSPGFLPNVTALSLTASDIVVGNSVFFANGARFVAVGPGAAEIRLIGNETPALLGSIRMDDSMLRLTGSATRRPAGIRIEGGRIALRRTELGTTFGEDGFGGLSGPITIRGDLINISGGVIAATSFGAEPAGDILIAGRDVTITDGASIETETFFSSTGDSGSITIAGSEQVRIAGGARLSASTASEQRGGDIRIRGGRITIEGTGDFDEVGTTTIQSQAFGEEGDAGAVLIEGDTLDLRGAMLASSTFGAGDAGGVTIRITGRATVSDNARIVSQAEPFSTGNAGQIEITADELVVSGRSLITSSTASQGEGGLVLLFGRSIRLEDSAIEARALPGSTGGGGVIFITADDLFLTGTAVSSDTDGNGVAGGVFIEAGNVEMFNSGIISSRAQARCGFPCTNTGSGGAIVIRADTLRLRAGPDTAGLTLGILSDAAGGGAAGSIEVTAGVIEMEGGFITTSTFGSGRGGEINLIAREITLRTTDITSTTSGSGAAGTVRLTAGNALSLDGSRVASDTRSSGAAGQVDIVAGSVDLANSSEISTNSEPCNECGSSGEAGAITIQSSGDLLVRSGSSITSSTASVGNAGTIGILAGRVRLEGGRISTSTTPEASGAAGLVVIDARAVEIEGAGSIETISRNSREAGGILIATESLVLNGEQARISSSNESAAGGNAGGLFISAGSISLLEGARLTSSSVAGAAGSIEIFMPATGLLRLESRGTPSLITTSSGPGTGGRIVVGRPLAIISNGGSILALGEQGGANVELNAEYLISSSDRTNRIDVAGNFLLEAAAYDVSAGTVNRDLSVIDASGVLRGQCAAVRSTGQVSQLVVRPIGPYSARPTVALPDPRRMASASQLRDSCS